MSGPRITHAEFAALRLRDFAPRGDIVELKNWRFRGREWIGEAIGFSEWLRPVEDPERLGSLSLHFEELPLEISNPVLDRLGLPLAAGLGLTELRRILGTPSHEERLVKDRVSSTWDLGGPEAWTIDCTVHEELGLIHVVLLAEPGSSPTE